MSSWTNNKQRDDNHLKEQLDALDLARERLISSGGNASLVVGLVLDKEDGQYVYSIERRGIAKHFITIAALLHNRLGGDGVRAGLGVGPSNDIILALGRRELCIDIPVKH